MTSIDTESTASGGRSARPKIYKCEHEGCTKAYAKPSLLEQHVRSHTNERPFQCEHEGCNKSFLRKSHLQVHAISHEKDNSKPYHCAVCGKGVNTPQHLKRHEITHTKSFDCTHPGCNESFYKHQSLRHHILSVHEKALRCESCDKTFSRPYRLAQHNLKFHGDSPTYVCDHQGCFKSFKTWSALQLHVKTDHPKLKCVVCGKGCVGKKGLRSHMISHDDQKMVRLWNCQYCDLGKFSKKVDLITHYNAYHDKNMPPDLLKPNEKEELERLLQENEPEAGSSHLSSNRFDTVLSSDEDNDEGMSETRESKLSLETFNSTLRSGKTSIMSMIVNNRQAKLPCPKKNCERNFNRQYDLDRHLKWHEAHIKKIEDFLNSLDTAEGETDKSDEPVRKRQKFEVDDLEIDDELDELIDIELKSLKAGEAS